MKYSISVELQKNTIEHDGSALGQGEENAYICNVRPDASTKTPQEETLENTTELHMEICLFGEKAAIGPTRPSKNITHTDDS